MTDYRVNLDVYNGPLDLLLYLIRRDELDIHDIPIARITEQYVAYVEALKQLDPNLAGEFLVMAATLMEIKTRMLLPSAPAEEGQEPAEIDPRAELVRQLLQYKAFKDAAGDLRDAAAAQAMKFPRRPPEDPQGDQPELDLEDVQIWDLFDAFSRLMEAIGQQPTEHQVIYDETPLELHAADILDRLGREGPMPFAEIFRGRQRRAEIIGLFLALLELIRQRKVLAGQERNFGEIHLALNPSPPPEPDGEEPTAVDAEVASPTPAPTGEGQWISENATPPQEGPTDGSRAPA